MLKNSFELQAGRVGLLLAICNCDPAQEEDIEAYFYLRIRGGMLDEIRKSDWTPRRIWAEAREMTEVVRVLNNRCEKKPSGREIAEELNITMEEYHKRLDEYSRRNISLIEDEDFSGKSADVRWEPQTMCSRECLKYDLGEVIEGLPPRERLVVKLYHRGFVFREIGEVIGVGEGGAYQIYSRAKSRIATQLRDWVTA